VHAKELAKFFKVGESVRILQGCHAGEPGQILEISDEKHAVVLMENTRAELKVLITNLRRKEEQDPNCRHSLSEFLVQNNQSSGAKQTIGKSIAELYSPGDLILFENYQSLGFVLQVQPDTLKVLTEQNRIEMVKRSQISKRIAFETKGVGRRARLMRKAPVVMDKYHNVCTVRTIIKPVEKGPFYGCLGEVRAISKDQLFVLFTKSPNLHLLRESHGYYAIKAHQLVNSGYDLIDRAHSEQQSIANDLGLQQGKTDKRIVDKKARGTTVFITRGPLKGYKGKIVHADEVQAKVEIFAKGN